MDRIVLPNDEPTVEDLLQHAVQVQEVARFIEHAAPPYVLGVHGDWGAGKTSFLLKVAARLKNPEFRKCEVVFFEAWRHQFEDQPVVALLQTIRDHFSLARKVWKEGGKLASVSAWTGLRLLDDLMKGVTSAATEEGQSWERRHYALPLASNTFRSAFEQAIKELTGRGNSKLVVLIDDLDRCSDTSVVRLLESIKLYLSAENCVFVIAADRRAIVRAIHKELFSEGSASTSQRDAEEYSEKLFQSVVSLRVPQDLRALVEVCWRVTQREQNSRRAGLAVEVSEEVRRQRDYLAHASSLRFLPPNPRKVKRYLVELQLRVQGYRETFPGQDLNFELACAVQAVQTFHPDIYRVLANDPPFWGAIADFAEMGPMLSDLHEAFTDLVVPDRGVAPPGATTSDAHAVRTFHDPGDLRVFLVARIVRSQAEPPGDQLHRMVTLTEPPVSSGHATGPEGAGPTAALRGATP